MDMPEQSQRPTNNVYRLYRGNLVVETQQELEECRARLRASKATRAVIVGAAVVTAAKAIETPTLSWIGAFAVCGFGYLVASVAVQNFRLATDSLRRSLKSIR